MNWGFPEHQNQYPIKASLILASPSYETSTETYSTVVNSNPKIQCIFVSNLVQSLPKLGGLERP